MNRSLSLLHRRSHSLAFITKSTPSISVSHHSFHTSSFQCQQQNPSENNKKPDDTLNAAKQYQKKFHAQAESDELRRRQQSKKFRYRMLMLPVVLFVLYSVLYFTDFVEYFRRKYSKSFQSDSAPGAGGSTQKALGKPKVGGAFTLVETKTGLPVTDSKFRGKYLLIYFGFTNCPDICPEEMEKVTKSLQYLEQNYPDVADKLNIVFVSVDPYRDSLEAVNNYLKDFHPKYIGLTGTPLQVKEACRKYRVFYSAPDNASRDGDYAVDHSIYTYLMDEYGELVEYFSQDTTQEEMADGLLKCIRDGRSRFVNQ